VIDDDENDAASLLGGRRRRKVAELKSVSGAMWTIACAIFKCRIMTVEAFPDADMMAAESYGEAITYMIKKKGLTGPMPNLTDSALHTV
jgi:hypothetical protein